MNGGLSRWGSLLILAYGCGQSARDFGTADQGNAGGGSGGTSSTSGGSGGKVVTGIGGADTAGSAGEGGTAGQGEGGAAGQGEAGEDGGVAGTSHLAGANNGGTPSAAGAGGMSVDLCVGVVCAATDQCHDVGKCQPATGKCSNPNKADDHTSCGTNVECVGGTCSCTRTSCPNGCCAAGGACAACAPTTVITRTNAVQDVTVGGGLVYFLESSSVVYSLSSAGGATTMLTYPVPSATLTSIHVDGSYVYGGKIGNNIPATLARMAAVGGPFNEITGSKTWEGTRLISNSTGIFAGSALSSNYITVSPKDGSSAAITLVSSPAVDPGHFAVDEAYLYFISASSTVISRVPVAGGGATTVVSADTGETFNDVAVSGSQLLIATSKRVAKVAAAGGSAVTLDTGAAYVIRADATNAYFLRSKGTACASGSELYSIPVAGGNLRRLAVEPLTSCIRSLVHDASNVYWLADKSIQKIAK